MITPTAGATAGAGVSARRSFSSSYGKGRAGPGLRGAEGLREEVGEGGGGCVRGRRSRRRSRRASPIFSASERGRGRLGPPRDRAPASGRAPPPGKAPPGAGGREKNPPSPGAAGGLQKGGGAPGGRWWWAQARFPARNRLGAEARARRAPRARAHRRARADPLANPLADTLGDHRRDPAGAAGGRGGVIAAFPLKSRRAWMIFDGTARRSRIDDLP